LVYKKEIILVPKLSDIKIDDSKLKRDLQDLQRDLNKNMPLKLSLSADIQQSVDRLTVDIKKIAPQLENALKIPLNISNIQNIDNSIKTQTDNIVKEIESKLSRLKDIKIPQMVSRDGSKTAKWSNEVKDVQAVVDKYQEVIKIKTELINLSNQLPEGFKISGLDGIDALKSSISGITNEISNLQQLFKLESTLKNDPPVIPLVINADQSIEKIKEDLSKVDDSIGDIANIESINKDFANGKVAIKAYSDELKEAFTITGDFNAATGEMSNLVLANSQKKMINDEDLRKAAIAIDDINLKLKNIENNKGAFKSDPQLYQTWKNLNSSVAEFKTLSDPQQIIKAQDEITEAYKKFNLELTASGKNVNSFFDRLGRVGERFLAFRVISTIYREIGNQITNAITQINDLATAQSKLEIATNSTAGSMGNYSSKALEMGASVGRTATEIVDLTTKLVQMGRSIEDAFSATQTIAKLGNITGTKDLGQLATDLQAIANSFNITEEAAANIISNASIGASNATQMLKSVAASLSESGMDIKSSLGLLTSIFQQTGDTGAASGLVNISNKLRGVAEDGSKLSDDIVPKLKNDFKTLANIDISDGDVYRILSEMKTILPTLTEETQRYLKQQISGNNLKSIEAILNGWDSVEKAVESASNAQGSLDKNNKIYMDSIQGRTAELGNSFQTMASTIVDSDINKGLVSLLNTLVKAASAGDGLVLKLGFMATALATISKTNFMGRIGDQLGKLAKSRSEISDRFLGNIGVPRHFNKYAC